MIKLCILAMAAWSVSLAVCADTPSGDQSQALSPVTTIAPLVDVYDSVWIKGEDGVVKTLEQVADDLSRYDVVFFGEFHGHSGVHLAQMRLFRALQQRYPDMTLSLEQFERDTQPLVDKYLAGEIGEKVLTEEGRGWDNYEQSYRPLVEFAKDNGLPVVASEAPKQAVICISKEGPEFINEIPMPDREWVAKELHIQEGPYLDKYMAFLMDSSTHGPGKDDEADADKSGSCADIGTATDSTSQGTEPKPEPEKKDHGSAMAKVSHSDSEDKDDSDAMSEMMQAMIMKSFSAQVLRDDTMAESIAMHLQANPDRKVIHLDGNFHSASHLGTVERLKLRMPDLKIAVINPIAVEDNKSPAFTDEDASTGDYILLVRETPEMFVCEARELEYHRKVIKKRMGNKCVYSTETENTEE
jgi:uncharacterized iron-regulated protein